jgi:glycosyltransferase involved in cell wall biosynthesis
VSKPNVTIFADYYLPGYLAGGPIRSVSNLVEALGQEMDLRVITLDRDLGAIEPYPYIQAGEWQARGKAQVCYLAPKDVSLGRLKTLLLGRRACDGIYLNSFLSPTFTLKVLLLRRLGSLGKIPILLNPRGELAPSALAQQPAKKQAFIAAARLLGLYRHLDWHATNADEVRFIRTIWGKGTRVHVASNIPAAPAVLAGGVRGRKVPGKLSACFLSRICTVKNLDYALSILAEVRETVELSIFGPIEDEQYWEKCQSIIATLPANIAVNYRGPAAPPDISHVFQNHDLLILPTKGENYGHVIAEALREGCPVLISDKTPWRNLTASRAGWDLPLDHPESFRDAVTKCVRMDDATYLQWSTGARQLGSKTGDWTSAVDGHRAIFSSVFESKYADV